MVPKFMKGTNLAIICYKSFSAMVLLKLHMKETHGSTLEVLKNSGLERHLTENQIVSTENVEDEKCSSEIINEEFCYL